MAGAVIGTYDPSKVQLKIGTVLATGFGDGTFIKVARMDKETFKTKVGAGGEVSRVKNPNIAGTVTIQIKSTSPFLKTLAKLNAATIASGITYPVMVKNASDTTFVSMATSAWLSTEPDVDFDVDEKNIEIVISCADLNKGYV